MNLLMIPSLIEEDYEKMVVKILVACALFVIVGVATIVDLQTAIQASKKLGISKTRSHGLRRTGIKLREYWALMAMGAFIDFGLSAFGLISESIHILQIFTIPFVSIIIFIGLMVTESISVKENIELKKGSSIIPKKTFALMADIMVNLGENSEDKLKALAELLRNTGETTTKQTTDETDIETKI